MMKIKSLALNYNAFNLILVDMDNAGIKELMYKIIGASMNVHRELNYGLLEAVYQECLSLELDDLGIANETEKEIPIYYKNHLLKKYYKMDVVVGDVICELKAVSCITPSHRAQICNYLRLTHKPFGLLINFGSKSLVGERWAYDLKTNECYLVDKNLERLNQDGIYLDFERDDYALYR